MEQARVVIIEDSDVMRFAYNASLSVAGHQVVAEATSMTQVHEVLGNLEPGQVDIAIVDGNLTPGARGCDEGARVVELIREMLPEVRAIGASNEQPIRGADINVDKGDIGQLLGYIASV